MTEQQVLKTREKEGGASKMKPVLIVEDEAIVRESLRDWLEDVGYEVETAEQGEEALQRIGEVDFGIVILDLRLPGKDGLEVLREVREQRPQLKGVIITAYPSVETAVEAMKLGAVDYLPKPFAPEVLEELIQQTLGLVQVEIRPKTAVEEAIVEAPILEEAEVEAPVVEEAEVEGIIAVAPEEIPVHLKQGKEHFNAGRCKEALKEFEAILDTAPENIEARVWLKKAREALAEPRIEGVTEGEAAVSEEAKPKECLWMRMGMVSYRLCTNNYDCLSCEFDQMMQEKMASGETPELDEALVKLKELPGIQRLCRYAVKGDVSYRLCTHLYQCATCEFGQMMDDALQRKIDKLATRREALRKKEKAKD